MEEYLAHVTKAGSRQQTLREHSENVKQLCMRAGKALNLESLAGLIGLLHDLGKATISFRKYLLNHVEHYNHAMFGAKYAYESWFSGSSIERLTDEIIALCIYGHHAGLPDALNIDGISPFISGMESVDEKLYQEAKSAFFQTITDKETLNKLFHEACKELETFGAAGSAWKCALLARLMLSILVDADRWDSACFEYGADPFNDAGDMTPPWLQLLCTLEEKLSGFSREGEPKKTRWEVSDSCKAAGSKAPGIYSLTVPTGGGKTLSSLRFALTHAASNNQRRIFYIIPYNTILDQNAKDIRKYLNDYNSILEHHANVVIDDDGSLTNYKALTERWDSDIILTSLVQFMNALYRKENTNARRMRSLTNSILIFDEIQSLPNRCQKLFKNAIAFLVAHCNCSVVLCTATQPRLEMSPDPEEIIDHPEKMYSRLKRVRYIYDRNPMVCSEASDKIVSMVVADSKSVLAVVNTKSVAWDMFVRVEADLHDRGISTVEVRPGLSDEELIAYAQSADPDSVLCVHLSTHMCAAHRKMIIEYIKAWRENGKRTCCISTALIEAGIDISFPVVVRSLAGLPSIIQAGGRCNRNLEEKCGDVYIWIISDENISRLPEIQNGQRITQEIAMQCDDLSGLEIIQKYYDIEAKYDHSNIKDYPYKKWNDSLLNMLGVNAKCHRAAGDVAASPIDRLSPKLSQSFRTAGDVFRVIDENTLSILVPYGEGGKELIARLNGAQEKNERIADLRRAQQYSVNLFQDKYDKLQQEDALIMLADAGVVALRDGYYDMKAGVCTERHEVEFLIN